MNTEALTPPLISLSGPSPRENGEKGTGYDVGAPLSGSLRSPPLPRCMGARNPSWNSV